MLVDFASFWESDSGFWELSFNASFVAEDVIVEPALASSVGIGTFLKQLCSARLAAAIRSASCGVIAKDADRADEKDAFGLLLVADGIVADLSGAMLVIA